jgi:hypothetical protein
MHTHLLLTDNMAWTFARHRNVNAIDWAMFSLHNGNWRVNAWAELKFAGMCRYYTR